MTDKEFEHTIQILLKNYENKNYVSNEEAVIEATNSRTFWSEQVHELLKLFKDEVMHFKVLSAVSSKIRDRHNRLALFNPLNLAEYKK